MAIIKKIAQEVEDLMLLNGELGYVEGENRIYIGKDGVNRPIINVDVTKIDPTEIDDILARFNDLAEVVAVIKNIADKPVINTIDKRSFLASDGQTTFPFTTDNLQDVDVYVDGQLKFIEDDYTLGDNEIVFNNGLEKGAKVITRAFYGYSLTGLTAIDVFNLFPDGIVDLNQ